MTGIKVYVAGPYTQGDVVQNIKAAIDAGEALAGLGFVPFIPHLTAFWHFQHAHCYGFWLDYTSEWLLACDALLRLPGPSNGADSERRLALTVGIPVYYTIEALRKAYEHE